jgi:adenine-specific DNA-methyltransferase
MGVTSHNHIEELIWTQATANSQSPNYSTNHEYVEVYARDRTTVEGNAEMFREPKPGYAEIMELLQEIRHDYPSIWEIEGRISSLFQQQLGAYKEEVESAGLDWGANAKRQDPWRGIYPYNRAEYRDNEGRLVAEDQAKERKASIWIWSEISAAAPASKQSATTKDPSHYNFRYYKPIHPVTGKPCAHPRSGWKFPLKPDPNNSTRKSFQELERDQRIVWGENESKLPRTKGFLHEVESNIGTSVFYAYNDGESELTTLFGEPGLFLSPKSSGFVQKFVRQAMGKDDYFLDFFAGTGSSGHAVVNQNRHDKGSRKFLLIEVGTHFETLLLPRLKKVAYSPAWREGDAVSGTDGTLLLLKYMHLESYEDALNNLELRRTEPQQSLLDHVSEGASDSLKEQYLLKYVLDIESRGSQSLLNVAAFTDPTAYKLKVKRPGTDESREVNVDLLETFNWLIGLTVQRIMAPQTFSAAFKRDREGRLQLKGKLKKDTEGPFWFRTITGTSPDGRNTLVIWRKLTGKTEEDNLVLETWFQEQGYASSGSGLDLIYVNGDNSLENLKTPQDTWRLRLIEEDFHRLMFDSSDI